MRDPVGVSTRTLTRRSPADGRRRTSPRDSRRSTSPVTLDASQARVSASWPMGMGRCGSMRWSTWHCAGDRRSSAASRGRLARWAKNSRTMSGQAPPPGGLADVIQDSIVQYGMVDIIKYTA